MPLPTIVCPNCNARYSLDAAFAHEAAREVMLQIADAYPGANRLLRPLLRYIGLFAPAKNEMSFDRVAKLLGELAPMIKSARIERHGRAWVAPLDTWIAAIDEMLARRDQGKLTLPLKSHGYLLEVVAGLAGGQEARAETNHEERLRSGHRDTAAREQAAQTLQAIAAQVSSDASDKPREIPAQTREQLLRLGIGRRRATE